MSNTHVLFSEVLPNLTEQEIAWLSEQLQIVFMYDNGEICLPSAVPESLTDTPPAWVGPRFLTDVAGVPRLYDAPFSTRLVTTSRGRHLWIFSTDNGNVQAVGILVAKFLAKFRPDDSWLLRFAIVPPTPEPGKYGGGLLLVAADGISISTTFHIAEEWQNKLRESQEDSGDASAN